MNIIITGGTKGLGSSLLLNFHLKDFNVVTFGSQEFTFHAPGLYISKCDITKTKDINRFLDKAYKKFKSFDILINNAGIVKFNKINKLTDKEINQMIDVNLKGAIKITREYIKRENKGYIINIGSTRAITGAPNKAVYSASKFGLRALTQTINKEYDNFKSTIICPGALNVESTKKKGISTDKLVQPIDIFNTINYLLNLSEHAHVPEIIIGGQL